jgi:hypothetical protein
MVKDLVIEIMGDITSANWPLSVTPSPIKNIIWVIPPQILHESLGKHAGHSRSINSSQSRFSTGKKNESETIAELCNEAIKE